MTRIFHLSAFLLFFSVVAVHSEPLSGDAAVHFLQGIEQSFSTLHSLKTNFTQEKDLKIFSDKLVSSGVIYFQSPDKMRMEFDRPFRSLMLVDGESVQKFSSTEGVWKNISVTNPEVSKAVGRQMSGWLTGHFESQADYYTFFVDSTEPIILRLVPRTPAVKEMIQDIRVTFTANQKQVQTIEIREPSGDDTIMTFSAQETNQPLKPELFKAP